MICIRAYLKRLLALLTVILLLFSGTVAAEKGATTDVTVKGTLIVQPYCVLNNNQNLNFDYGSVAISDIDTKEISVIQDIKVTCQWTPTAKLQVTLKSSNVVLFKPNVIKVGDTGMGIAMLNAGSNDAAINLNKAIDVTDNSVLRLKGKLVNVKLWGAVSTGRFSTAITIETTYP